MMSLLRILEPLKFYLRPIVAFLILDQFAKSVVEGGGDLGSIDCVKGKWQVDTKIISLIIVCPIQISWETLMCIFKRLGLYENDMINEDLAIYLCSLLPTKEFIRHCIIKFNECLSGWGGIGGLNQFSMGPIGICIWRHVHEKMNCTV